MVCRSDISVLCRAFSEFQESKSDPSKSSKAPLVNLNSSVVTAARKIRIVNSGSTCYSVHFSVKFWQLVSDELDPVFTRLLFIIV